MNKILTKLPGVAIVVIVAGIMALLGWRMTQAQYGTGGRAIFDQLGERRVERRFLADFNLPLVRGDGSFSTASLRGKVVMVDFYASWCPPCRQDAPVLSQVFREYESRGVMFLGIGIWDDPNELRKFDESFGTAYPTVRDDKGLAAVEFGISGLPEKFFLR